MKDDPLVPISRADRDALTRQLRMNFKVLRNQIEAIEQQRIADFEEQLATEYPDNDLRWAAITAETNKLVRIADKKIKTICAEHGIPDWARPEIRLGWYRRGENAIAERRVELTKVAKSRFKADAAAAKVELERQEAEAHGELIGPSLTSDRARELLAQMPSVDQLMPRITVAEIETVRAVERVR